MQVHLLAIWPEKSRIYLHKIGQSSPSGKRGRCAGCSGGYLDTMISSDESEAFSRNIKARWWLMYSTDLANLSVKLITSWYTAY